jgi:choline kinase
MNIVILAAGVGNRLRPFTAEHPKCLLTFGGKSLLQRHLEMLDGIGVAKITIVVGHLADQIEAEVKRVDLHRQIDLVYNPQYRLGSGLSLLQAESALGSAPAIIMDADLLLCREMVTSLFSSSAPNCLLADERLIDTGEEVKVLVRSDGTVCELGKQIHRGGSVVGESVGLYKFSSDTGHTLVELLRLEVADHPRVEYEAIIDSVLGRSQVHYVPVGHLPWIEIDFPHDVERAREEIWPLISKRDLVGQ